MSVCETPAELRDAFDQLLAATRRQLRLYDHDLALLELDQAPRHDALRSLCVAGGGRRIEILLDDISRVRTYPRLMHLVRDFSHVIEIRQADPEVVRPDQAFVLGDRRSVLLRPDKHAVRGGLHLDSPRDTVLLDQDFESLWQRAPASVSATTLGL